jgi:NAD(P)-dependent dehydrogenase (short-subunit alcohol dehydrogenase family)
MGRRALPVKCDVRIDEEVRDAVDQAIKAFGRYLDFHYLHSRMHH